MDETTEWLTVPDFASALGVEASAVRELLRQRQLIALRRGPRDTWQLPAGFIHEHEGAPRVLPTLAGTITVLADAGFPDDEILEWLLAESEPLGTTPLEALREGRRAPVRRAAQMLL
ncbi:Rv2175c family DNA-binding protein [Demequina activiva]|uniref:Transcriptional regulator n=1 Tax=Demequina activiva TaxID=1582364 RepID=A0A919Q3T6_9MICO|nr:Rv2175c family DNA-binding protein [Demequina activiva]GIG54707.1 transcriptional regulator [Demequina activiva]